MKTADFHLLSLVSLLLGGCHSLVPYQPESAEDAAVDRLPEDGLQQDHRGDGVDGGDARADMQREDGTIEPDQSTDGWPPGGEPCAAGGGAIQGYAPDMVACDSASAQIADQCAAQDAFCNVAGGWHMCTVSEYLDRGGQSTPSSVNAWLAGCVRDGGPLTAPTDQPCTCAKGTTTSVVYYWACDVSDPSCSSAGSGDLHVGVVTASCCRNIGTKTSTAGMWAAVASFVEVPAAVCCQ